MTTKGTTNGSTKMATVAQAKRPAARKAVGEDAAPVRARAPRVRPAAEAKPGKDSADLSAAGQPRAAAAVSEAPKRRGSKHTVPALVRTKLGRSGQVAYTLTAIPTPDVDDILANDTLVLDEPLTRQE